MQRAARSLLGCIKCAIRGVLHYGMHAACVACRDFFQDAESRHLRRAQFSIEEFMFTQESWKCPDASSRGTVSVRQDRLCCGDLATELLIGCVSREAASELLACLISFPSWGRPCTGLQRILDLMPNGKRFQLVDAGVRPVPAASGL